MAQAPAVAAAPDAPLVLSLGQAAVTLPAASVIRLVLWRRGGHEPDVLEIASSPVDSASLTVSVIPGRPRATPAA